MAGKGGGAWKVAYADFVTAMMAFFMVMWIVAQNKPVRDAVAGYFRDPSGSSTKPGGSGGGSSVLVPLGTTTKTAEGGVPLANKGKESGGIKKNGKGVGTGVASPDQEPSPEDIEVKSPSVFVLHDGEKKNIGTVILFAEDSAELDAKAQRMIDEVLPALLGKRNKIEVRGHASRRPLPQGSKYKDGWELSFARAVAVMQRLEEKGVEPERFRPSTAGGFEPYTQKVDAASLARNSRVELYLLNEVVEDFQGGPKRKPDGDKAAAGSHSAKTGSDNHGAGTTPTKTPANSAPAAKTPSNPRTSAPIGKTPAAAKSGAAPPRKSPAAKSSPPRGAAKSNAKSPAAQDAP